MTSGERRLKKQEYDVLKHLLSLDFPGAKELQRQLRDAWVTGSWSSDDRSPSIDIKVEDHLPAAPVLEGIAPVRAIVRSEDGEPAGELILWLTNGTLSALEYSWVTDHMPSELPGINSIDLSASR